MGIVLKCIDTFDNLWHKNWRVETDTNTKQKPCSNGLNLEQEIMIDNHGNLRKRKHRLDIIIASNRTIIVFHSGVRIPSKTTNMILLGHNQQSSFPTQDPNNLSQNFSLAGILWERKVHFSRSPNPYGHLCSIQMHATLFLAQEYLLTWSREWLLTSSMNPHFFFSEVTYFQPSPCLPELVGIIHSVHLIFLHQHPDFFELTGPPTDWGS